MSANELEMHQGLIARIVAKIKDIDPILANVGHVDCPDEVEVLNELPAEDRKILKNASEAVKFEPVIVNTNAGGASSKKSINKESNEPQKVQETREDKRDDLVR